MVTEETQDVAQVTSFEPEDEGAAGARRKGKMGRPTTTAQIMDLRGQVDEIRGEVGGIREGLDRVLQAVSDLTIQGRPIPIEQEHLVPYAATDQGRAEVEAARVAAGKPEPSGVRITRSEFDGACERFGDAHPNNWTVQDPLTETATPHKRPGRAYRFLDEKYIEKAGMRNWEFVRDPTSGDVVKNGGMMLAEMPIERKLAREKHYEELNRSRASDSLDRANEQQERLLRQAAAEGEDVRGGSSLRPGEVLRRHDHDGKAFIGLHTTRGLPQVEPKQI